MKTGGEVTQLLARVRTSEGVERKAAHDKLVTLVYGDLRRRAQVLMRNERNWTSMQPTARFPRSLCPVCSRTRSST